MIGRVVGEYCVTGYVGAGSMGDVYHAQHATTGVTVAIKFIPESRLSDDVAKRQFLRGARAWAALDHPHICRFHGVDETPDGRVYVVMAFCEGETLHARIARGPCEVRTALEIVRDVADGLAHAHKRNVIHRDIKPANLMFDQEGRVKIVDFGLAKLDDATASSSGAGTPGTFLYMSPEQLNGDPVDGRADIFALGCVLYEMLTGASPFHAERLETVLFRICNDYPHPLSDVLPDAPEQVQEIIDRALQKDPQTRYQTASEMRENLQAALAGVPLKRQRKPRSKRKWVAAGVGVAAAVVAAMRFLVPHPTPVGVAVVSAAKRGSAEDLALARGLAHDLADRARYFARDKDWIWVVTPDRMVGLDHQRPEDLNKLLGANLVITIGGAATGDRTAYALQSYSIASLPVMHQRLVVDCGGPLSSDSLDLALQTLVGFESRVANRGYPKNPDAYRAYLVGLGHLDTRSPDLDRAIESLQRAVATDSAFARAWAALGESYRLRGVASKDVAWFERAESACRRGLALERKSPEALVTIGQIEAARKRNDDAIASYRAALAVDDRNNVACWRLADVYVAAGQDNDAVAAYAGAVDANPDDPRPAEWLGYHLYRLGRYREAIAPLERVSRLIPAYGPNYNMLGGCYFAIDCWENATTMFEKSFELERNYGACTNLGTLYYMNGKFEDAARMYEWALEYNPSDYAAVGALGAAQFWSPGHREQGIELYREASRLAEETLSRDGESAVLLAELSGYYAVIGHDSTIAVAERAAQLEPGNPDVLFRVAMTYEHLGKRPKALLFLRTCIQNGYSLRHIDSEPFLTELRKDVRYARLVQGLKRPGCDT